MSRTKISQNSIAAGAINSNTFFGADVVSPHAVANTSTYSVAELLVGGTILLDNTGKVGIGTSSPGEALEVYRNAATTHSRIKINNPHANAYSSELSLVTNSRSWLVGAGDDAIGVDNSGDFHIYDATATAYRMVIKSNGNVGIGTTSPGEKLHVEGTVDADNFKINGAQGSDGQVLTSTGSGVAWEAAGGGGGASAINDLSDAVTNSSGATIGLGTGALANDDGSTNNNTALGHNALNDVTSGYSNVAIGAGAGQLISTAQEAVYIGRYAGGNSGTAARNNVVIGNMAGYSTSSDYSVYVGDLSGQNGSGNSNVGVGRYTLYQSGTGYENTAVGTMAGFAITDGIQNCIFGKEAGYDLTTGNYNSLFGPLAGENVTSGQFNVCIGYAAGDTTTTGDNQIVIGKQARASAADVDNEITLGNSSITSLRCNQTTISSLSDLRDKTDIEDLPIGLDFIKSLRPVKFRWDRRDGTMSNVKDAGFIAQELDEVQQTFNSEEYMKMVLKINPEKLEAAPGKLIPVLVKAIQELSQEVERLKEGK